MVRKTCIGEKTEMQKMASQEMDNHEIQTFVFFDLETSCCTKSSRILELSMLAVSRKDLLEMKERRQICRTDPKSKVPPLPRVTHKLTKLYYPRKVIYPIVEEITGLNNNSLEHLSSFNADNASEIKSFLALPAPVCLVAHNGKAFDFPILKAELLGVKSDNLPGVLCVDSLIFARKFEETEKALLTDIAKQFSDKDFEQIPVVNGNAHNHSQHYANGVTNGQTFNAISTTMSTPSTSNIFKTPEKNIVSKGTHTFPHTPQKKTLLGHNGGIPLDLTPQGNNSDNFISRDIGGKAKRALYNGKDHSVPDTYYKKPFSQPSIYYRHFRTKYDAHRAECDATALMQICAIYNNDFVEWADKNYSPFESVNPRWSVRKSFMI